MDDGAEEDHGLRRLHGRVGMLAVKPASWQEVYFEESIAAGKLTLAGRPREGGDPVNAGSFMVALCPNMFGDYWMPAFAGMTSRDAGPMRAQ